MVYEELADDGAVNEWATKGNESSVSGDSSGTSSNAGAVAGGVVGGLILIGVSIVLFKRSQGDATKEIIINGTVNARPGSGFDVAAVDQLMNRGFNADHSKEEIERVAMVANRAVMNESTL